MKEEYSTLDTKYILQNSRSDTNELLIRDMQIQRKILVANFNDKEYEYKHHLQNHAKQIAQLQRELLVANSKRSSRRYSDTITCNFAGESEYHADDDVDGDELIAMSSEDDESTTNTIGPPPFPPSLKEKVYDIQQPQLNRIENINNNGVNQNMLFPNIGMQTIDNSPLSQVFSITSINSLIPMSNMHTLNISSIPSVNESQNEHLSSTVTQLNLTQIDGNLKSKIFEIIKKARYIIDDNNLLKEKQKRLDSLLDLYKVRDRTNNVLRQTWSKHLYDLQQCLCLQFAKYDRRQLQFEHKRNMIDVEMNRLRRIIQAFYEYQIKEEKQQREQRLNVREYQQMQMVTGGGSGNLKYESPHSSSHQINAGMHHSNISNRGMNQTSFISSSSAMNMSNRNVFPVTSSNMSMNRNMSSNNSGNVNWNQRNSPYPANANLNVSPYGNVSNVDSGMYGNIDGKWFVGNTDEHHQSMPGAKIQTPVAVTSAGIRAMYNVHHQSQYEVKPVHFNFPR